MRARCEAESVDLERATVIGRNGDVFVARLRQDLGVSRLHCRLVPPEASRGWRLEVVSQAGCRLDDRALAAGAVVDLAGEQLLALGSDCRIRLSLLDEASESSDEEADDDDDDGVLERLLSRKSR